MERQPRTKPADRNTMRVTIKTPPDKKRDAGKQPPRSPSRRRASSRSATTNKLTIRERFVLSFSVPLILVSLGLLTFIAGHVIARMVGRAKARKAERIATAYVEVLNVSRQPTATSEAAIAIATEMTSLGAAALLNVSQSVVTSRTVPVFIDIYIRKGHRPEGGWRSITIEPKMLDDYPVLPLDDALVPGTTRSAADLRGPVTPAELATIIDDYDRGRAIGATVATTSTTAAPVMGSARRDYISKGPESWKTTASVRTTDETKTGGVIRAEDTGLAVSTNAKPSGTSVTPTKGVREDVGPAGWSPPGAFSENFFDPYHNRDEDKGPFPDNWDETARARSSTTVLQAASLFDVPPIDDILVATATTDGHRTQNRSAFITAIDQTEIVVPVSVLVTTRADTSSETETVTLTSTSSTATTPTEMIAVQQALVPVETDAPSLTSTPAKASEQPQERTTRTMDGTVKSALTSTTLNRDGQFETATTSETPGNMVTGHTLIDGYGATPKEEEFGPGPVFSSTEPTTSTVASQTEVFVPNERIGSVPTRASTTSSSTSTDEIEGTVSRVGGATQSRSTGIGNKSGTSNIRMVATTGNHTGRVDGADKADVGIQARGSSERNVHDVAPSLISNVFTTEAIVSRIYSAVENSPEKSFPEEDTGRNATGSPETNEYGCTSGGSLHTNIEALSMSTNRHAMSIDTPMVGRDASVQTKPAGTEHTTMRTTSTRTLTTGATVTANRILPGFRNVFSLYTNRDAFSLSTDGHAMSISTPMVGRHASLQIRHADANLTTMHATSTRSLSTAATVKARTMLPGHFRSGPRVNLATVVPVGQPAVHSFSESWASINQGKALSNTALSVTAGIPKHTGTPAPSARLRSFVGRSGVRSSVSLPATISPPTRTQRGDGFTTIASPIVRTGTNHREATFPSDDRSSRNSAGRRTVIPAMTIQTAVTGDRVAPTTKPAAVIRKTRTASSVRVSAFDKSTSPTTWLNNSATPIPPIASGTTTEATESHSIVIGEIAATATNTETNGVLKDTTSAGGNANITKTGKTGGHQPVVTNVAASAGPGSTFSLAKGTAVVSDADKNKIAETDSASNGDGTAFTTAVSSTGAENGRESGGMGPTTRNFVIGDPSSEAPAVTMASPVSPSENRTFPAWRINNAFNVTASPITAGGKTPVIDSANAAPSEAKSITAWRIRTAAIRHFVSVTASAATAHDNARPRSSSQDARAAISPAMIIRTIMTRNTATTTAKPKTAVRVPVSSFDVKPPPRLNSGVRISANAVGTPSFTTVFDTRQLSQDEVTASDKGIRPAWPVRSALTRHPMNVFARSSAALRGSSPVGSTRTTGPAETIPAMLIEAAVNGTGVPNLAKPGIGKTLVHKLVNMDDVEKNPTRTGPVNGITTGTAIADSSGTPPVNIRREYARRTEKRASNGQTATAWRIAGAIRMRSPRPAVPSRPVSGTPTSGRN